jgi:hypothetical protein
MAKVKKVISVAVRVAVFARSPQGKRDITLIVAAVSAVADFLKQTGVV